MKGTKDASCAEPCLTPNDWSVPGLAGESVGAVILRNSPGQHNAAFIHWSRLGAKICDIGIPE